MDYNYIGAFAYYKAHIIAPYLAKVRCYEERHISPEGTVPTKDWNVFAAILVDDVGRRDAGGNGLERHLEHHEVRSGKAGAPFTYYFGPYTHQAERDPDYPVDHIYVLYDDSYDSVDVYLLRAKTFAELTATWKATLDNSSGRQTRGGYRRGLGASVVAQLGNLVLSIRDRHLVHPEELSYVNANEETLAQAVQAQQIRQLLDEMNREYGPVSDEHARNVDAIEWPAV